MYHTVQRKVVCSIASCGRHRRGDDFACRLQVKQAYRGGKVLLLSGQSDAQEHETRFVTGQEVNGDPLDRPLAIQRNVRDPEM
jgi:hypothetical protein